MPTGTITSTRTATSTSTLSKINYVTRKVQPDFLAILDTYGYFSAAYGQQLIHDVRVFLDEEVIDRIGFVWTRPDGTSVLEELKYTVVAGRAELTDDRAGGITYRPELAQASFQVQVTYTARWKNMPEVEKNALRKELEKVRRGERLPVVQVQIDLQNDHKTNGVSQNNDRHHRGRKTDPMVATLNTPTLLSFFEVERVYPDDVARNWYDRLVGLDDHK